MGIAIAKSGKESRYFCDGVAAQQGGALRNTNPWPSGSVEYTAWDMGWFYSDNGTVDLSCCAVPVAGALPWETSGVAYVAA